MARARGYRWSELGLVEKNGRLRRNMDGGGVDERWGRTSRGLWLKATSFPGNRSSVHVIRQGGVGVPAAVLI